MIDWLAIVAGAGLLFLAWLVTRPRKRKPKLRPFTKREMDLICKQEQERPRQ